MGMDTCWKRKREGKSGGKKRGDRPGVIDGAVWLCSLGSHMAESTRLGVCQSGTSSRIHPTLLLCLLCIFVSFALIIRFLSIKDMKRVKSVNCSMVFPGRNLFHDSF